MPATTLQTHVARDATTRRKMVQWAAGLAGAAPLAITAACEPAAQPGQPSQAPANVTGSVTYMDWRLGGSPADEQFYNTVRDGFLAKYPGVKWEQIQAEWGTVYRKRSSR
jgi:ABC-type glycerol-3-phosphate transport system substrate-binding protein